MKVYVDWDGVCVPRGPKWGGLQQTQEWMPGAVEALMQLDADVYTCRLDNISNAFAWNRAYNYIRDMLDRVGLQHIGIYTGEGKPAGLIVDDNALHFRSWAETLPAIMQRVAR